MKGYWVEWGYRAKTVCVDLMHGPYLKERIYDPVSSLEDAKRYAEDYAEENKIAMDRVKRMPPDEEARLDVFKEVEK